MLLVMNMVILQLFAMMAVQQQPLVNSQDIFFPQQERLLWVA